MNEGQKIIDFLLSENSRITCGSRWLVVNSHGARFTVRSREPYQKVNRVPYEGDDLDKALEALKGNIE